MRKTLFLLSFLFLITGFAHKTYATHLRAGDITVKRISTSTYTYQVTLITYTDEINGKAANDNANLYTFFYGNSNSGLESISVSRTEKIAINAGTVKNVYDTTITLPGPGSYTISCGIVNRNANTINLGNDSGNISFFVQTTLFANSAIGLNSSPVMLNLPLDSAAVGAKFVYNPGAFDIDGDSLSYKLTMPRKNENDELENGKGVFIEEYKDPTLLGTAPILNEEGSDPATFSINSLTGDLIWDAPRLAGQYNVAFVVEEWRKAPDGSYIRISEIIRDMQIIVVETENNRPIIEVPDELCIEAGDNLNFDVSATDIDNDQLVMSSSGGLYNKNDIGQDINYVVPEAASFESTPALGAVTGTFDWNTNCEHVRDQAYDVVFKVTDFPDRFATQLTDIKTVKVKVLPASIKGLTGSETDSGVNLTWQDYISCDREGRILVYRKEGCNGQTPAVCSQGINPEWGYTLIDELPLETTSYLDENVVSGTAYSYRMVVELDVSRYVKMQSPVSNEFCQGADIKAGMPVIIKTSVLETSTTEGEVLINWTSPLEFNPANFPGPYEYKLYRSTGLNSSDFELVHSQITDLNTASDLSFTDTGLNTAENAYRYRLEFYTQSTKLFGSTSSASTVWLTGRSGNETANIFWQALVPWTNDNKTHVVYRMKDGVFNKIAVVNVTNSATYSLSDNGVDNFTEDGDITEALVNGEEYCYKVETFGEYPDLLTLGEIANFSQEFCVIPRDNTPPCSPQLTVSDPNCGSLSPDDFCDSNSFTNVLSWSTPTGTTCQDEGNTYDIFYSRYEGQESVRLATVSDNQYTHIKDNVTGFAGCYSIVAINPLGLRSAASNTVCIDNCEVIEFPNVFSPNDDNKNDFFTPMNCPALIKNISYEIFNRTGTKVASGEGSTLKWDGKNEDGNLLPPATYYYSINVEFERLEENSIPKTYKGWVQIVH